MGAAAGAQASGCVVRLSNWAAARRSLEGRDQGTNVLPPMHAALLNGIVQFHTETWLEVIAFYQR
jgi:hypothetical protein